MPQPYHIPYELQHPGIAQQNKNFEFLTRTWSSDLTQDVGQARVPRKDKQELLVPVSHGT
jgi:hypothetical protein